MQYYFSNFIKYFLYFPYFDTIFEGSAITANYARMIIYKYSAVRMQHTLEIYKLCPFLDTIYGQYYN